MNVACSDFELDPTLPYGKAMVAGATAGVMEHIVMYPVDTIKTLTQADATRPSIAQVCRHVAHDGIEWLDVCVFG